MKKKKEKKNLNEFRRLNVANNSVQEINHLLLGLGRQGPTQDGYIGMIGGKQDQLHIAIERLATLEGIALSGQDSTPGDRSHWETIVSHGYITLCGVVGQGRPPALGFLDVLGFPCLRRVGRPLLFLGLLWRDRVGLAFGGTVTRGH